MGGEQVSLVLTQLAVLAVLNRIQVLALLVAWEYIKKLACENAPATTDGSYLCDSIIIQLGYHL